MKLYDKKELTFRKGMLVTKDGDALRVVGDIVAQANALEDAMQERLYLEAQPEATPAPSLDGFERKSIAAKKVRIKCSTPLLDKKVEETKAFMDELDSVNHAEKIEDMANSFIALIEFADDDCVLADVCGDPSVFDTPMLGNPLEYTSEDILASIALSIGMGAINATEIPEEAFDVNPEEAFDVDDDGKSE